MKSAIGGSADKWLANGYSLAVGNIVEFAAGADDGGYEDVGFKGIVVYMAQTLGETRAAGWCPALREWDLGPGDHEFFERD